MQEGDVILIKDQGDPRNPPTVSAPDHTEKIELQALVDIWHDYLHMHANHFLSLWLLGMPAH